MLDLRVRLCLGHGRKQAQFIGGETMRIVAFKRKDGPALAVRRGEDLIDLATAAPKLPRELAALLAAKGGLQAAKAAAKSAKAKALIKGKITYLPTVMAPPKIICVGLNYI